MTMITKIPYGQGSILTIRDDPSCIYPYIPTIVDGSSGVAGRVIGCFHLHIERLYGFAYLYIVVFFLDESRLRQVRICHIIPA
jgi:hypothetical protein